MDLKSISKTQIVLFILGIAIDVLNLGEQISMYAVQKSLDLSDDEERLIFYIFIGVNSGSLIRAFACHEIVDTIISVSIEIAELFTYLFALPQRTTQIMTVAITFSGVEIVLHVITITILFTGKASRETPSTIGNEDSDNSDRDGETFCKFIMRLMIFIGAVTNPILTLFVDSKSRFRQVFYEILLILTLFFSSQIYGIYNVFWGLMMANEDSKVTPSNSQNAGNSDESDIKRRARYYFKVMFRHLNPMQRVQIAVGFIVQFLLAFVLTPLVWIILASLELRDNGSNLKSYDRGLYISYLVIYSVLAPIIWCCMIPCGICLCCFYILAPILEQEQ